MKISCVLLDDDPLALELIRAYGTLTEVLEIKATFTNPLDAHAYLCQHEIQVLFSDVVMPQLSGLDLVKSLHRPPLLVLVTAFPQYAVEAFNCDALDFLQKPVTQQRFLKAVDKVADAVRATTTPASSPDVTSREGSFFIRTDAQYVRLCYQDVLYLEALKDFTKIHLLDGRVYLTLVNLKNLEEQLPTRLFIRTHRSFLVNAARIESLSNQEVRLGGQTLPLGQTYREQVLERVVYGTLIRRQQ